MGCLVDLKIWKRSLQPQGDDWRDTMFPPQKISFWNKEIECDHGCFVLAKIWTSWGNSKIRISGES